MGTGTGMITGAGASTAGGAGFGAPLITGRGVIDDPEMHAVNDTSNTSARQMGWHHNRAVNSSDMQGSRNATANSAVEHLGQAPLTDVPGDKQTTC